MALFKRNPTQRAVLPEEVNDYYKAQRRERTGVALMLGLVALVVTLIAGFALFLGGRWAYQKLSGKNKTPTAIIDDKKAASSNNQDNNTSDSNKSANGNSSSNANNGTSSNNSSTSTGSSTGSSNSSTGSTSSTTTTSGNASPALGDEPATPLPHTGDEGH
ncbi:hypothetical protein KDA11_07095 [Candidatus Saccharibacteria bacterium]|nr:hypothetical protein [Candidatus Saccharibacteria bacterium]